MPVPVVSEVSPKTVSPAGGTPITIQGSGFVNVTAVTFGDTPATDYEVNSESQITAVAPAHAAGTVAVRVGNKEGLSQAGAAQLTYTEPDGQGRHVHGCCGAGGLDMGGPRFTIRFATQTTGLLPMKASGVVDIIVSKADRVTFSLPELFGVLTAVVPTVSCLVPNAAPHGAGTLLTINGSGFNSDPSHLGVLIGPATISTSSIQIISDNVIQLTIPTSLGSGSYGVRVGNLAGSTSGTDPCSQLTLS